MIDYRAHMIALDGFKTELETKVASEPAIVKLRPQQLDDLLQYPGMAALGALSDHLMRHAASDGEELALLERAAGLWAEGVAIYAALGACRAEIETALQAPTDPGSPELFNNAVDNLRVLGLNLSTSGKLDELDDLRRQMMKLHHIAEHPRQRDLPVRNWGWGDVFLARSTDAFARSAYRLAQSPALNACAFGILSSYSANFCGSAYLEQVVGGPRRLHRFRDRVAANSVGSWFAQTDLELRQLSTLADLLRFGADPAAAVLPAEVESFFLDALMKTYDPGQSAPLPDLQLGYARLIRHLELLDGFAMPAAPAEPALQFVIALYADPSNPPTPLFTPQAANYPAGPGQGGGSHPTNYAGAGNTPTKTDSAPTTGERCGSFWMGLIYAIMFLGGGFAPCIGAWAQGNRCTLWDAIWKEFGDANKPSQEQMDALASQAAPLTVDDFPTAAATPQMITMVGNMFDLQCQLWEGLAKARAFLAIHGLIYPDGMLNNPVYSQFLTVPAASTLPLQEETDPAPNFYRYPPGPVENPAYGWAPYASGAAPSVFIGPASPLASVPTASRAAAQTWLQIARGDLDAQNYDMDADRGFQFPCWTVQGSIHDDPLAVQILPYEGM
jgi:hypothetical protein